MPLKPAIFLSYSWANTDVANKIDDDFKIIGIRFKRDIRDIKYRTSIKDFMKQVGQSDFVLMIVSDEYLLSENCMYEVMELLNTNEFEKRVLPIVTDNARTIFKPLKQSKYYDHWLKKLTAAKKFNSKHSNIVSIDYEKRCRNVYENLAVFFQKLTDLNTSSYETLRQRNYQDLLNIIGFDDNILIEEIIKIGQIENVELQELAIEKFLIEYPFNKFGLAQKASFARDNKQYQKAKLFYEEALRVDPEFVVANVNLAIIYAENIFDVEEANHYFKEALKADPLSSNTNYNFAKFLAANGDEETARLHYKTAIADFPGNAEAHTNLGLLMIYIKEERNEAKEHFDNALSINPNLVPAHNGLAVLLTNQFEQYLDAEKHYKEALKIDPYYLPSHFNLALLYQDQLENYNEAKKHYEAALSIDPTNKQVITKLDKLLKNHFNN